MEYMTNLNFFQSLNSLEDDEVPDSMISDGEMPDFTQISIPDLSTYRVSIPRIGARPEPENPKKQFFVFIIDIRRVDMSSENDEKGANWIVDRYTFIHVFLNQWLVDEMIDLIMMIKRNPFLNFVHYSG